MAIQDVKPDGQFSNTPNLQDWVWPVELVASSPTDVIIDVSLTSTALFLYADSSLQHDDHLRFLNLDTMSPASWPGAQNDYPR